MPPEAVRVSPLIPFSPMPGGALTANTQMLRDNNILHKFPEVINIMLSGQADEDAIERAFTQANLYKCIKKPWSEAELVESICAAMGQFSRLKSH